MILFFYHMHQPSYINKNGIISMPWVFLHALKDYYDMPYLILKTKQKAVFNLTSTLITQLKLYNDYKNDKFLTLMYKNISLLDKSEKEYLLKIFNSLNKNMIKNEYFNTLINKEILTDYEFLDLEVLFLLAWCGNYLKENNEFIKLLLNKNNFKEDEKIKLLNISLEFIGNILNFYKKLQNEGVILISTTPFYHPILPLLINFENAKKANPLTFMPKNYISLKDDAILQVKKAVKLYKKTFETAPIIFWPAEGAVDSESIELYKKEGIKFIATDEEILKKSGKNDISQIYNFNGVKIMFRNHFLSDLIGFKYRFLDVKDSVDDFISKIDKNKNNFIILDGENAWEYYKNGGYDFLENLYLRLKKENIKTFLPIEINDVKKLDNLQSGSWIYGNFDTWVNHFEKIKAWELLFKTKKEIKVINDKIEECFLKAECSDWFWWYGEEHNSMFKKEFDILFRNNLMHIYELANEDIPEILFEPIVKTSYKSSFSYPKNYITPIIDGKISSFFEWLGSGEFVPEFNSMQENSKIKKILFGEDKTNIYFAIFSKKKIKNLKIFIKADKFYEIKCKKLKCKSDFDIKIAYEDILEISIKKEFKTDKISVYFEIDSEITPNLKPIDIDLKETFSKFWYV